MKRVLSSDSIKNSQEGEGNNNKKYFTMTDNQETLIKEQDNHYSPSISFGNKIGINKSKINANENRLISSFSILNKDKEDFNITNRFNIDGETNLQNTWNAKDDSNILSNNKANNNIAYFKKVGNNPSTKINYSKISVLNDTKRVNHDENTKHSNIKNNFIDKNNNINPDIESNSNKKYTLEKDSYFNYLIASNKKMKDFSSKDKNLINSNYCKKIRKIPYIKKTNSNINDQSNSPHSSDYKNNTNIYNKDLPDKSDNQNIFSSITTKNIIKNNQIKLITQPIKSRNNINYNINDHKSNANRQETSNEKNSSSTNYVNTHNSTINNFNSINNFNTYSNLNMLKKNLSSKNNYCNNATIFPSTSSSNVLSSCKLFNKLSNNKNNKVNHPNHINNNYQEFLSIKKLITSMKHKPNAEVNVLDNSFYDKMFIKIRKENIIEENINNKLKKKKHEGFIQYYNRKNQNNNYNENNFNNKHIIKEDLNNLILDRLSKEQALVFKSDKDISNIPSDNKTKYFMKNSLYAINKDSGKSHKKAYFNNDAIKMLKINLNKNISNKKLEDRAQISPSGNSKNNVYNANKSEIFKFSSEGVASNSKSINSISDNKQSLFPFEKNELSKGKKEYNLKQLNNLLGKKLFSSSYKDKTSSESKRESKRIYPSYLLNLKTKSKGKLI